MTVESHMVELPDGRIISDWPWIITPEFAVVVVLDTEGQILLFRQTKYGLDGASFAPVGGYLEPGEEPRAAAERELMEEMGCTAEQWVDLGTYVVDANRGAGKGHLYMALGARQVRTPHADDLEERELVRMTVAEARAALLRGEFKALAWAAASALAFLYLDAHKG